MATRNETRHGKHKDNLVGFGGYITPELKAICAVTANEMEIPMMDLVRDGILYHATRMGVIENGAVTDRFKDAVALLVDIYMTAKRNRKAKNANEGE